MVGNVHWVTAIIGNIKEVAILSKHFSRALKIIFIYVETTKRCSHMETWPGLGRQANLTLDWTGLGLDIVCSPNQGMTALHLDHYLIVGLS